jgi:hypothetical protein
MIGENRSFSVNVIYRLLSIAESKGTNQPMVTSSGLVIHYQVASLQLSYQAKIPF